ncbi:Regulatory protein RecX [Tepidimonas alkaliphilus]|uniref:Regulatory protein RecX n=1 Tax=Tepidimonas alkaliphilus TaxID=2588942 RepID=A0A554WBM3_9BURK|nr:recombination regulator RecX [Tepidimonas alkaliphilus]TSE20978.1 Regulatory protein RecX [Tepidimonas alkaliphilus]
MAAAAPTLKARALRLLARRDYTRQELAQRLAPHAADAAELEAVLDECARRGWLDEARALEAHLHRRAAGRGRARLQAELRARGFADEVLLEEADARLAATEAERAQAAWARRFGTAPRDAAERARQLRFLLARGFAPEVARRTVPRVAVADDAADGEG